MHYIKFDKTVCGVDFLLNVLDLQHSHSFEFKPELQATDYFQIYFIKSAHGFLYLNESHIELKPNTVVFISKNQNYSWHGDFEAIEGQLLIFQDDFLNDFFSDQYFIFRLLYFYQTKHPLSLRLNPSLLDEYLGRLREIKKELVRPQSDSVHLIRSIVYYLLIALNRNYAKENTLGTAISLDNTAYQFRKLVEQHIHKRQRVEDYAMMMQLSRIALNKAVKAQFNMTATAFIKSRLVFELKMRLLHSNDTVQELAYTFHFSEANHLSRFFKQQTGYTPMSYRAAYQNGISL